MKNALHMLVLIVIGMVCISWALDMDFPSWRLLIATWGFGFLANAVFLGDQK